MIIFGLVVASIVLAPFTPAHAANANQRTPSQICQAQALNSLARQWPNMMTGEFQVILKDSRCLMFVVAPSAVAENKKAAWLLDGKTGEMMSEFYASVGVKGYWEDNDEGYCTYRGDKSGFCTWGEYLNKVGQM